ncbi:PAS domain-containing protein [Ditylenchus destructor]|nr:PAS domain-containing protein [Ditylenchus destructor]
MAVSHMKSIRETSATSSNHDPSLCKPSFLTDQELKYLILEAANGFLFVLSCDTGRVLYVADSILPVLNLAKDEWLNHSIYDLIHPDDIEKVRDQLCGSEASLNRLLDMKHGTVKKDHGGLNRMHMNCRRGFICRMRIGNLDAMPRLRNRRPIFTHNGQHYAVMHCTGYVKNSPPAGVTGPENNANFSNGSSGHNCLVAIGRLQISSMPYGTGLDPISGRPAQNSNNQFTMRVAEDGKVTFVDQKAVDLLGSSMDEMLGKLWWKLAQSADEPMLHNAFNQLLVGDQPMKMSCRLKSQRTTNHVNCNIDAYKFLNPYSEQLEYIVASIEVLPSVDLDSNYSPMDNNNGAYLVANNPTAQMPIYSASDHGIFADVVSSGQPYLGPSVIMTNAPDNGNSFPQQTPTNSAVDPLWTGVADIPTDSAGPAGRYLAEFSSNPQQDTINWAASEANPAQSQWQDASSYMM